MKATCSIDECTAPVLARSWCRNHYNRWQRHGDPLGGRPPRPRRAPQVDRSAPLTVRFWVKVEKTDRCWNWIGAKDSKGYGLVRAWGRTWRAHRVAWVLAGRELIDGMELDHLCRNPSCVRPSHLDQVTTKVNTLRSNNAAAKNAQKTHCPQGHEYTAENTRTWRGWRICRACRSQR